MTWAEPLYTAEEMRAAEGAYPGATVELMERAGTAVAREVLSRFGDVTLGRDGEEPEFRLRSWFAMLFSAGMGIGLMFWGVAEPLFHYASPPPGVEGSSAEVANAAMGRTSGAGVLM